MEKKYVCKKGSKDIIGYTREENMGGFGFHMLPIDETDGRNTVIMNYDEVDIYTEQEKENE